MSNSNEAISPTARPQRDWRSITVAWLHLILAALLIATLTSFAARLHWLLELFVHFKLVYFVLALGVGIGFLATKRRKSASISALLLILHAPGVLSWYIPRAVESHPSASTVTILAANVLSSNQNRTDLVDYIRERRPDIALLQEISPEWLAELKTLEAEGYTLLADARFDNFGMATLTRLEDVEILHVDLTAMQGVDDLRHDQEVVKEIVRTNPIIELQFSVAERHVQVLNIHPLPPVGKVYAEARDYTLQLARAYFENAQDMVILVGDLNTTPWSPAYKDTFNSAEIVNARQGFGIFPTYPSIGPLFPIIPIDHVLISPEIRVTTLEYTPEWGSDHAGLWVELAIPQN